MFENGLVIWFSLSERSVWEHCGADCSCRDGLAPLNCVIHVSGSQMSLHTRLHSKHAIIYANSAAYVREKPKHQALLLLIAQ